MFLPLEQRPFDVSKKINLVNSKWFKILKKKIPSTVFTLAIYCFAWFFDSFYLTVLTQTKN